MRRAPWRRLASLAWRESRSARRRLLLYMSSISLGVAALVAIDSYAANVTRSVREQSRALLGGDASLASRQRFPVAIDSLLDSLAAAGVPVARQTTFMSMAVIPRTAGTRLAQVRAVSANFPFYGEITTRPAGRFAELHTGRHALVDPALLVSLGARVGDSLALGHTRFRIVGALGLVPGDAGITAAIGPRVFIADRWLPETGLLVFGSRAEYEALLKAPESGPTLGRTIVRLQARLDRARIRVRTVADTEGNLTDATTQLAQFLGIVGLVALLLGGIGVASGVHAFVMRKIDTVAVLRCLGATSGQVVAIYVVQAAAMGLVGAAVGVLLGVGVQYAVPYAVGDFMRVQVQTRLETGPLLMGLGIGVWVALVFALRPLVMLRHVSPLQTLRRDADADALRLRRADPVRGGVTVLLALSVITLAVARSSSPNQGLVYALAIAATLGVLWASAAGLTWVARRLLRQGWPFPVRQGVANLYRPGNQTRAVLLSLGFGAFLISTVYQVGDTLLRQLDLGLDETRANVVFFDVQDDQALSVDSLIRAGGHAVVQRAPLVQMRIAAINGTPTAQLITRAQSEGREVWMLRREYRSTFRDTLVGSERLVAGRWFDAPGGTTDTIPQVSFEQEVAGDLGLQLGDVVTWDVQGVRVPSRVTSLREVTWARFEPNFFAVFEPGAVDRAPKQYVVLARVHGDTAVARLQHRVVERHPNVSSLDLTLVQRTIGAVLDRVAVAVRFMALFSVAMGLPVLFSAVAATRRDRVREGVLLKTLGATRAQVRRILLAEYALLGLLGSLTGVLLSMGSAWALARFEFEIPFVPSLLPAVAVALGTLALTVTVGVLTGRDVFAETPMAALREA